MATKNAQIQKTSPIKLPNMGINVTKVIIIKSTQNGKLRTNKGAKVKTIDITQ